MTWSVGLRLVLCFDEGELELKDYFSHKLTKMLICQGLIERKGKSVNGQYLILEIENHIKEQIYGKDTMVTVWFKHV